MNIDALSEDALRRLSETAGEPSWLTDRRLAAFKRYVDQRWPDSRLDEFWRSTPFDRRFDVDREVVTGTGDGQTPASIVDGLDVPCAVAKIVDGVVTHTVVPAELSERGVVVTDMMTAASEHEELVRTHLGSLTTSNSESSGADEDRTITANDAAWTSGVFVHVPAEVELDAPIAVHQHVTVSGAHLPRVLMVVGHHAKVRLYLEHTSEQVDALVDEVVEIIAEDSSKVDVAAVQAWDRGIQHLGLHKIAAHRDTTVRTIAVTTGGDTVRLRPEVDLLGPGADVQPLGLYFADDGQWFDLQPYVRHLAPRATSNVLFKGALQGRSRTVFRGNVFVHRDAVGTSTDENNRSLILTEGARADATPFLEIECADITAGHGSATGQIDALQLFYLESRGVQREDALRLIVFGFFRDVLAQIDLPGIEEAAMRAIEARIDTTDLSRVQINDAALREMAAKAAGG